MFYVYGYNTNEPSYGLPLFVCLGPKCNGFKSEFVDFDDAVEHIEEQAARAPHIIYTISDVRPHWWG